MVLHMEVLEKENVSTLSLSVTFQLPFSLFLLFQYLPQSLPTPPSQLRIRRLQMTPLSSLSSASQL